MANFMVQIADDGLKHYCLGAAILRELVSMPDNKPTIEAAKKWVEADRKRDDEIFARLAARREIEQGCSPSDETIHQPVSADQGIGPETGAAVPILPEDMEPAFNPNL